MTTPARKNILPVLALASIFFFVGAAAPAFAVTVTPASGCPTACSSGRSCHEVKTDTGSVKTCMTAAEVRAAASGAGPAIENPDDLANPGSGSGGTGKLVNPLKVDNVEDLLNLVLAAAVRIGTIILILALIWVGFLFVAARGNPEKLSTAKAALFWTLIGGLILLGAQGIASIVQETATKF